MPAVTVFLAHAGGHGVSGSPKKWGWAVGSVDGVLVPGGGICPFSLSSKVVHIVCTPPPSLAFRKLGPHQPSQKWETGQVWLRHSPLSGEFRGACPMRVQSSIFYLNM